MVAPYRTEMVFLCSCFPWRTVAGAGAADRVAALPQIQRFLFMAELALAPVHLFVAMVAPEGVPLMEAAAAESFPSVYL